MESTYFSTRHFDFFDLYSRDQPTGETILDALIPLVREHPDWQAGEIAEKLGVRRCHLSGAVTILTGMTLDALLKRWRMYKALELLRLTELDFATIAQRCGYQEARYLADAMKREMKMTPFEYRNGYRRGVERPRRKLD